MLDALSCYAIIDIDNESDYQNQHYLVTLKESRICEQALISWSKFDDQWGARVIESMG